MRLSCRKGMFHPSRSIMLVHSQVFMVVKEEKSVSCLPSSGKKKANALLLALGGAGESVGDALASVAEGVLSLLHDALALVGGIVAAGAGGVAELLSSGLLALWCTC
jgi:hypothetical protein